MAFFPFKYLNLGFAVQAPQFLLGLFEDLPLPRIQFTAGTIDVEHQHRHGRSEWV